MTAGRLELDYVAAPRRAQWLGVAVLAVALGVATFIVFRYQGAQHDLAALEAAQGLLNVERKPRAVSKERLEDEVKQVDSVVRQLTLPWAQMIEAVEAASTGEVAVLQLQPEAQQRLLRLMAEAKSREAMLRYVKRLGETKALSEVHLINHQILLDNPSRPVQFGVQASFRGTP
ncbi:MAG TPA: hypothetical protein VF871_03980 [Burkholderiales bacterium]